jgi:hypothetical protein
MRWSAAEALSWVMRRVPRDLPSWTPDMGPEIETAQKELAAAIGAEKVRAWGRLKRDDPEQQIPSDKLRHTGLVVDFAGELTTSRPHRCYEGERGKRWKWIEFEEDEIKRAWPTLPSASAAQWMLTEAKRLQGLCRKGKRADMVKDCMKAIGCTKREAEAAHAKLAPEFKRPRGKSPKNAG